MSNIRVYIVTEEGKQHLVEASNGAQALRHVAQARFKVRVAKSTEVSAHMRAGGQVDVAGETKDEG